MARLSYPVLAAEGGETLPGSRGDVGRQILLGEQLAIRDLGGVLLLGRREALRGGEQRLAPRSGRGRHVGGGQVVLGRRRGVPFTGIRVADAAGGFGHGGG